MLNVFATGTLYTFIKNLRKTLSLKKRKNIGPSRRLGRVTGKNLLTQTILDKIFETEQRN